MSAEFFEAVKMGDRATVERMLEADPRLALADESGGVSAVLTALYWRKPEIARMLADRKGELSIFEATALGDLGRVRAQLERDPSLANAFASDGFQPLGLAAFFGHAEIADLLLERGAEPSTPSRNEMRVTALHSAVAAGHGRIARALIKASAEVNVKQRHGWTPLHGAAERADRQLVTLLLDAGADPSAKNDAGMDAAGYARSKGDEGLARLIESRVRH